MRLLGREGAERCDDVIGERAGDDANTAAVTLETAGGKLFADYAGDDVSGTVTGDVAEMAPSKGTAVSSAWRARARARN